MNRRPSQMPHFKCLHGEPASKRFLTRHPTHSGFAALPQKSFVPSYLPQSHCNFADHVTTHFSLQMMTATCVPCKRRSLRSQTLIVLSLTCGWVRDVVTLSWCL